MTHGPHCPCDGCVSIRYDPVRALRAQARATGYQDDGLLDEEHDHNCPCPACSYVPPDDSDEERDLKLWSTVCHIALTEDAR